KISHFEKTEKNIFGKPKTAPIFATSNKDTARPAGGIGRRVGLKHQYLRMCRFDSGAGYFSRSEPPATRFFCLKTLFERHRHTLDTDVLVIQADSCADIVQT